MMKFEDGVYHEPGIYFGMPFEEYLADWSLGSSDLINLLIAPSNYYWHSRANPLREEERDTPYLRYGRAIHKAVLEGIEAFHDEYAPKPPPPEPGALVTLEDLKAKCRELGLAISGTKAALIERIRAVDRETPIYDELVERHKAEVGERTMLDHKIYGEVVLASGMIRKNPHLVNAFEGGYPEVSVFFEYDGVPMRARFDYLKPRAIVDLKSMRNHLGMPWDVAVANSIARHDYPIQASSYLVARAMAAQYIRDGRVFGKTPPKHWLRAVADENNFVHVWVFFQAEGAPLTKGVVFDQKCPEFTTSMQRISHAINLYKEYLTKYGSGMWVEESKLEHFSNLSMPLWYGT